MEDLGEESVDGEPVRRLSYDFDLALVWGHMTTAEKNKVASFYIPDELAPEDIEDLGRMMDVDKVEVWVDSLGFNRRTIMDLKIKGLGAAKGSMGIWIDTRMSRFNEVMSIEAPAEFQKLEDVAAAASAG